MTFVSPITLSARGLELRPMTLQDEPGLRSAAADGELWNIRVTSVPEPENTRQYIEDALAMREAGNRFPFVVIDSASGRVLGTSSYHDIVPAIKRLEIGWTWYAKSVQRSHVNTTCKLLLIPMPSRPWAAMWWAGAQTISISPHKLRLSAWVPRKTV